MRILCLDVPKAGVTFEDYTPTCSAKRYTLGSFIKPK